MPKFFLSPETFAQDTVYLSEEQAAHLKVLRVRPGEELILSDGNGSAARAILRDVSGKSAAAEILERMPDLTEPTVEVTVCAALPKGDKAELLIQKAVELGAARVLFFLSERCVSRPDAAALTGKVKRWQKIAESAAEQCGRGRIPEVNWVKDPESVYAECGASQIRAFLWENAGEHSLRSLLRSRESIQTAALVTGPEGGFSDREAHSAEEAGFLPVTLGPRILRCETAPLAALAAVMYETGNFEK